MALVSRCLLAVAMIVLAFPARAEVVTLLCKVKDGGSFTLWVDYDRKMVADANSDGNSATFVPAKITEGEVSWEHVFQNVEVFKGRFGRFQFAGSLNRLSGEGWVRYWRMDTGQGPYGRSGVCSRAERKF
jgi:hypothetical protein